MDTERHPLIDAAELRRRAEARLRQKFTSPSPNSVHSVQNDNERLIQELQVHQIELEMQNEELLEAQNQLEQTLRRYTDLYEFAPVGYLTLTDNGVIQAVNLTGVTLLGRERASLIGRRLSLFIAEHSRPIFNFFMGRMQESASKAICEVTLNLRDNSQRYLQLDGLGVRIEGQYIYRITAMDITQRKQAEEALFRSEARYRQIVETANEGIWMMDDHYRTTFVNWRMLDMLGYQPDEMFTRPLEDFLFPEDIDDHRCQIARRSRGENTIYERRFRHKNGQTLWMLVSAAALLDAEGNFTGALSMLTDITERKQMEEELYRLTITDPLTNTFNRRYLMQVLDMETRRAQRYGRPLSLIMFDLDHFKQINDAFGHQQGDEVLKDVATRVQRRLRRTDHFVRWGGEEFMILTTETARSEALALAEILQNELRDAPFPEIGRVTASFGVSEYRSHEALDEWLKRVDDLVYAVKRDGRDHVQHDGGSTDL